MSFHIEAIVVLSSKRQGLTDETSMNLLLKDTVNQFDRHFIKSIAKLLVNTTKYDCVVLQIRLLHVLTSQDYKKLWVRRRITQSSQNISIN